MTFLGIGNHCCIQLIASDHQTRMDTFLRFVPPTLVWDCMKIDIQGADADALISAGDYIEKFKCVVGEVSGLL